MSSALFFLVLGLIWVSPSIYAGYSNHPNKGLVVIFNAAAVLFPPGWILVMLYALVGNPKKEAPPQETKADCGCAFCSRHDVVGKVGRDNVCAYHNYLYTFERELFDEIKERGK